MKNKEEIDSALEKYRAKPNHGTPEGPPVHPIRAKRPVKCRVSISEKINLAMIGPGTTKFDAEYDWDLHVAFATVEGLDIMVPKELALITFYKQE